MAIRVSERSAATSESSSTVRITRTRLISPPQDRRNRLQQLLNPKRFLQVRRPPTQLRRRKLLIVGRDGNRRDRTAFLCGQSTQPLQERGAVLMWKSQVRHDQVDFDRLDELTC